MIHGYLPVAIGFFKALLFFSKRRFSVPSVEMLQTWASIHWKSWSPVKSLADSNIHYIPGLYGLARFRLPSSTSIARMLGLSLSTATAFLLT